MVDWKKDLKLGDLVGRKSGHGTAVATPEPKPIGRRSDDEVKPEKAPIWKREIRLRKAKDEGSEPAKPAKGSAGAFAPGSADEGVRRLSRFARPGTERPEQEKAKGESGRARGRSPLAREISFRRRRKPEAEAGAPTAPAKGRGKKSQVESGRARGRSPFSREISFRRRRKPAAEAGAPQAPAKRRGKKSQVVGLKVGASHVAAAHVVANGSVELVQFAREPIERGVVVGGELRDPEALGGLLKEFFRRHKLPQKAVRLGIGTNRIGVRRFEISGLQDASHLENAIRFRAQEVLPIPLDEAVLDYQVVGETTDDKGQKTYRVLLVVAYRDLVQRYVRACRVAGLKLVGIDLEAFALLRALGPTSAGARDDAAIVVVSIGHDRSTFVVADGNTCEFARVLDWGGGALDVAIARALDLSPSQAEPIKHSLTLNATQERLEGHTHEQAVAVYEAVRRELQTFVRELVSSLHFYQNQPGSLGIGELTITGGTAHLPGLAAELQRLIGVSVRVGDPLARVETGKRVDQGAELGSLAVAIGLGLEE